MSADDKGNLVIYQTEDGRARIECRLVDETIWLSQGLIGELDPASVVRNFRTTAADGKSYDVAHYNLEAILAVGFRVKSPRGTQFRRWANTSLQELIVKCFVMDDERLKNPGGWDYFDELLATVEKNEERKRRQAEKGFDSMTFFVYETLREAGVTAAESVSTKIKKAFVDHPNWTSSEADQRELRKTITFAVFAEMDDLDRVTRIVDDLFSKLRV